MHGWVINRIKFTDKIIIIGNRGYLNLVRNHWWAISSWVSWVHWVGFDVSAQSHIPICLQFINMVRQEFLNAPCHHKELSTINWRVYNSTRSEATNVVAILLYNSWAAFYMHERKQVDSSVLHRKILEHTDRRAWQQERLKTLIVKVCLIQRKQFGDVVHIRAILVPVFKVCKVCHIDPVLVETHEL